MNDHKFCFIICTNNELYLSECIHYLEHLHVPDGYEMDLLTIQNAPCMTQGYNQAMAQTDAKYKIYMHQDVFILNRNFLGDLLQIFQSDRQVGMIGMVGYENVSPDGLMWHGKSVGTLFKRIPDTTCPPLNEYHYSITRDGYSLAAEIDGFLMATTYDIPWNTQEITGWDFYDAFHSMDFLEHGYKIAVPNQTHPWCMHDDGVVLNMTNYNRYRMIFMEKYQHYLGKHYSEIRKANGE